jgi:hypothetical protein
VDRSKLKVHVDADELNLREFAVNGGVYHVNLLQVPPEPKKSGHFIIVEGSFVRKPRQYLYVSKMKA